MNTESIIHWIILTILVVHTGIAWELMKQPGNILDRLPGLIEKIPSMFIRDILGCTKCFSGQVALWIWVAAIIVLGIREVWWGWMWVLLVIVLTDQLMRRYGYE